MQSGNGKTNVYLGLTLIGTALLIPFFSYYQKAKSSVIMSSFNNMIPLIAIVIRDGLEMQIESSQLVPGDVVYLEAGTIVPADIRIIQSNKLRVDNSSLTGESEPQVCRVECTNQRSPLETRNLVFSGTVIVQGFGKGIVLKTGDSTVIGSIVGLVNTTEITETILEKEIRRFAILITIISISTAVFFFMIGIASGFTIADNIINAVGIIVATVPEGILITVSVSLTIAAKKMENKMFLVKNLQSIETLGSTTCIFSDKTGTLTENKMIIVGL